jgi:hypothetical protein
LGCEQRAFDIRYRRRVVEFRCSALPADHPDIAEALMKKAASLCLLGHFTKALETSENALSLPQPHGITCERYQLPLLHELKNSRRLDGLSS